MPLFIRPLISLFFFSGFAVAGISAPNCSATWKWSFNSLGQNACTVAAYMLSTCHAGSFTVQALPTGYHYSGPTAAQATDLCQCNTIAYSLLSACDACQGSDWITWSDHKANCTKILPPGTFPNPIPSGTRLQQWALLDITTENTWDDVRAEVVGDNPELGPGTILGPGGPSSSSSSPSLHPQASTTTTSSLSHTSGSSSNTSMPNPAPAVSSAGGHAGIISGSTIGIVVVIIAVGVLVFKLKQRQPGPDIPGSRGIVNFFIQRQS